MGLNRFYFVQRQTILLVSGGGPSVNGLTKPGEMAEMTQLIMVSPSARKKSLLRASVEGPPCRRLSPVSVA